jgi:hypothetical protein
MITPKITNLFHKKFPKDSEMKSKKKKEQSTQQLGNPQEVAPQPETNNDGISEVAANEVATNEVANDADNAVNSPSDASTSAEAAQTEETPDVESNETPDVPNENAVNEVNNEVNKDNARKLNHLEKWRCHIETLSNSIEAEKERKKQLSSEIRLLEKEMKNAIDRGPEGMFNMPLLEIAESSEKRPAEPVAVAVPDWRLFPVTELDVTESLKENVAKHFSTCGELAEWLNKDYKEKKSGLGAKKQEILAEAINKMEYAYLEKLQQAAPPSAEQATEQATEQAAEQAENQAEQAAETPAEQAAAIAEAYAGVHDEETAAPNLYDLDKDKESILYPSSPASYTTASDWFEVAKKVTDMIAMDEYEFAYDTLYGIRSWILKHEHVTELQRQAVENIYSSVN